MPNDAKLGLLAGVIGVIAVALISANRPTPATGALGASANAPTSVAAHASPLQPSHVTEPQSTPIPLPGTDGTPPAHSWT